MRKAFVKTRFIPCVVLALVWASFGHIAAADEQFVAPNGTWTKWAGAANGLPAGSPASVGVDLIDPDMIQVRASAPVSAGNAGRLMTLYEARMSDRNPAFKAVSQTGVKESANDWPVTNRATCVSACRAINGRLLTDPLSNKYSDQNVYQSPGYGEKWTPLSNINDFCACSPPLQPKAKFRNGPPHWGTNAALMKSDVGWIKISKSTTPWGEIFLGTELAGFWHSLDNGKTWSNIDLNFYQPRRDASGFPAYPNPGYPDPAAGLRGSFGNSNPVAVLTRNREVLLVNGYNNGMYTSDGRTVLLNMPMSNHGAWTWHGKIYDVLSKDEITKDSGELLEFDDVDSPGVALTRAGSPFTPVGFPVTDGDNVYIGSRKGEIWKWTSSSPLWRVKMDANKTATCPGPVMVSGTVTDGVWKYEWRARGPGDVTFFKPLSASTEATFSVPGDYVLNLRAINGAISTGNGMIVHVLPKEGGEAPMIVAQPAPVQVLTVGKAASFAVTASGTAPLHYQWYRNGFKIVGAADATYTLASAAPGDDGATFYCVISSPYGRAASNCGLIGLPPRIVAQPINRTASEGDRVTLAVAAVGMGPLTWQWRKNGEPIAGPNICSLVIKEAQASDAGVYSVVVSNLIGSQTSDNATVTISDNVAPRHRLTIRSHASVASRGDSYPAGAVVPIFSGARIVDPDAEKFLMWKSSDPLPQIKDPASNATTIVMPDTDVIVTATYAEAMPGIFQKRLVVVNGSGAGSFATGDMVTIEALDPPAGMVFDRWVGGPAGVDGVTKPMLTFPMPASNITLWAIYKLSAMP